MQKEIGWLLKEKYNNKPNQNFYKDIKKLEAGEPLDYVIGFTEFLGCKIDLSKNPLIPRPETEFWTEKAIEDIKKVMPKNQRSHQIWHNYNLRILDIFAGSGCIGIAVLKNLLLALPKPAGEGRCDFADIDKKCLEQIEINCKINNISNKTIVRQFTHNVDDRQHYEENYGIRYRIIKSDVFKNVKNKYDYIFANPPYVAISRKNEIQKSVWKYEPKGALLGGEDGLFYIREFLKEAKNYLRPAGGGYPDGKIYMEFDSLQKKEIEKLIKKYKYLNYKFNKDQYGKWRWVVIK